MWNSARVFKLAAVAGAGTVVLWAAAAAASQRATYANAPSGNAQGLALLARVHAAYRHVPAVQVTALLGSERVRFTLVLRAGVATAEEFLGVGPAGTTILVARESGPTYAREPGTNCWRRLAPSDSQSLDDLGLRFPDSYRMVVKAPRRSGSSWLLPALSRGSDPGDAASVTLRINATSLLLESQTVAASGHRAIERTQALTQQPTLPRPAPSC